MNEYRCQSCEKLTIEYERGMCCARCWSEESPTGPGRVLAWTLPEVGERIKPCLEAPKWCHKK